MGSGTGEAAELEILPETSRPPSLWTPSGLHPALVHLTKPHLKGHFPPEIKIKLKGS